MKVIVFQVKEYRCALRVEDVEELLPMAKLWKTPGMPASMEGMLNLGGRVLPIFRMDRLFKVSEIALELYTPILLVKSEKGSVGFIIEKAIGVHTIEAKDVAQMKTTVADDSIEAEVTIKDQRVALLNIRKLLEREEVQKAKELETEITTRKKEAELLKNIAA